MPQPRTATFNQTTQVTWSDGSLFNGFALVGLVVPLDGTSTPYATVAMGDFYPQYRLPQFTVCPIINGVFNNSVGLYYNEDISPPNTQYAYWVYDVTGKRIAGPSALFSVSSSPVALPALTLTVPTVGSTPPTPDA